MFLVGYVHIPVVVESWVQLALSWVELTLQDSLVERSALITTYEVMSRGHPTKAELFLAESGACRNPPLGVPLV